jgi:hypothetical protein
MGRDADEDGKKAKGQVRSRFSSKDFVSGHQRSFKNIKTIALRFLNALMRRDLICSKCYLGAPFSPI